MHPALTRTDCAIGITEPQADRSNPIIWANSRWLDLMGVGLNAVLGVDPHRAHSGIAPEAQRIIRNAIAIRGRCRVLAQYRRPDGSTVWALIKLYPACEGQNIVGILHDWTPEIQERLRTLSHAQERLLAVLGSGFHLKEAARLVGVCDRVARHHRQGLLAQLGISEFGDLWALA